MILSYILLMSLRTIGILYIYSTDRNVEAVNRLINHQQHHIRSFSPSDVNSSCGYDDLIKSWLPPIKHTPSSKGIYYIVMSVSDAQVVMFANWLAIAVSLKFLPSDFIQLYIHCHGHITNHFVTTIIGETCQVFPSELKPNPKDN